MSLANGKGIAIKGIHNWESSEIAEAPDLVIAKSKLPEFSNKFSSKLNKLYFKL